MNAYFQDDFRRFMLEQFAEQIVGTPFVPHGNMPGCGMDCAHAVAHLLIGTGHKKEITLPAYAMDGGQHNATSQVSAWLDADPAFVRVWSAGEHRVTAEPGDVLCFKMRGARSAHHAGMMITQEWCLHSLFAREVTKWTFADKTLQRLLWAIYRPIEL